jgi:hypothetical protein
VSGVLRINPRSHTKAYSQAYIFLCGKYNGHRSVSKRDARIAAGFICKIWKLFQVGLHQMKLKHVIFIMQENPKYFINDNEFLKRNAIERMLNSLNKKHWVDFIVNNNYWR